MRELAALGISMLLLACSGANSAADDGAPTGSPTVAPSPPPSSGGAASVPPVSPSPTTSTVLLGPDAVAELMTTDLVVRSAPGVSAQSEMYPERLNQPMLLFVVDGPVRANGYDWYLVQPFTRDVCVDVCPPGPPFGWVAQAGKDGEQWIAPASLECPEPEASLIGWLARTARLACFGNETLVLEGTFGDCYAAETPVAFQRSRCEIRPRDYVEVDTFTSFLTMIPEAGVDVPWNRPGAQIRVTGHFDDPNALDCRWGEVSNEDFGLPPGAPPAELVILSCRQEFVVTDIAVVEQ